MLTFSVLKVQQSLEKIAKLEQEKEHWMLEAQLAKIRLEKDNKKVASKLKNSSSPLIEAAQESSIIVNATEQEDNGTEKVLRESLKSTSLVSAFYPILWLDVLEVFLEDCTLGICREGGFWWPTVRYRKLV